MIKRAFDIVIAASGLVILAPLLLVIAALVRFSSPGPVFFRQERVGRGFQSFLIYKFRTMTQDTQTAGSLITVGDDARITRIGWFLRKSKLDEFPQLINVLAGDMSLVGPRPEVRRYVELFRKDYEEILTVRPGITDLASVKYRDEAAVLAKANNPEEEYRLRVLPEKIRLAKEYIKNSSLLFDFQLICRTLAKLLGIAK